MGQQPIVIDPAGRDIHGEAAELRRHESVAPVELPGGIRAWAPTGFEVLRRLLTDDRVSKDPNRHWPAWQEGKHRDGWVNTWVGVTNMFTAYGADHRRLRGLVAPAFTKRRTDALRPRVEEITATLLDRMAAVPGGRADLRAAFAHPLPVAVICELFGVPEDRRADSARLVSEIFNTAATPQEALATLHEVHAFFTGLVAAKRERPADDLTSALIATRDEEGSRLTEGELVDTLLLVVSAGHETTVNLIGNAVHALLTHPGQLARVLDGEFSWNDVIEETLRWSPPVANLPLRYAVEDIELPGGVTLARGDVILATYAAAGRDPRRHGPDGDRFDVSRTDKEHLSFGHGVHFCVGAPLARLEASIALPALFDRFPGLSLDDGAAPAEPLETFISYGFATLPVRLARNTRPGPAGVDVPSRVRT
ncbi:cytochrome P450 [Streptomyces sp. NPDC059605]|uniref:cytochrome P450 family protein n=1 Tax=unclassified Streptomyces TaxID=2593676 RepID=UPI00369EA3E7